jgi:hypothetical protein
MIASSVIIVLQAELVVVFCKGSDLNPSIWKVEILSSSQVLIVLPINRIRWLRESLDNFNSSLYAAG